MAKTLSIIISDSEAAELLTKRTAAQWKQFLKDIIKSELLDVRRLAIIVAEPAPVQPDDTTWTANLS